MTNSRVIFRGAEGYFAPLEKYLPPPPPSLGYACPKIPLGCAGLHAHYYIFAPSYFLFSQFCSPLIKKTLNSYSVLLKVFCSH